MEIKPQELRIGNLISSKINRRDQLKVLQLFGDSFQGDWGNSRGGFMYESCEGIDLTPEWLEKFGFKKEGEGKYAIYHAGVALFGYWTVDGAVNVGQFIPRDIKHVHQLQNLYFALTGEELAIDNKSI